MSSSNKFKMILKSLWLMILVRMTVGKKLKKFPKKNQNIKGLNLTENFGQHNALLAGLKLF